MSAIRGLLFDYGGVIHDMRWGAARGLEAAHGLARNTLVETLYRTATWRALQCGRGDRQAWLDEAHAMLEAQAGRALPRLHDAWRATQGPIPVNVALIRALRPSYRTAILSNADASLPGRLRALRLDDLCEIVVCSAEVGIAKPDPAIYRLTAARLALAPEACLFVDDSEENVEAARQVGMTAVYHRVDRGDDLAAQLAAASVQTS